MVIELRKITPNHKNSLKNAQNGQNGHFRTVCKKTCERDFLFFSFYVRPTPGGMEFGRYRKKWSRNYLRGRLVDNRPSLHVGKTESILFGSGRRLKGVGDFTIYCDGMLVQRNFEVRYLGVLLDDRLTGSAHVRNVG